MALLAALKCGAAGQRSPGVTSGWRNSALSATSVVQSSVFDSNELGHDCCAGKECSDAAGDWRNTRRSLAARFFSPRSIDAPTRPLSPHSHRTPPRNDDHTSKHAAAVTGDRVASRHALHTAAHSTDSLVGLSSSSSFPLAAARPSSSSIG